MIVEAPARLTVEEYLAWEEANFEKHEYIDGEVRCMAGATLRHNQIAMNTGIAVGVEIADTNCTILNSDMRTKVGSKRYYYPDLSVVCGEALFARDNEMELLNPILVIEVTSPSSIDIDRGEKRDCYFSAPSIQAYLIIDQHRVCAELSVRAEAGWQTTTFEKLGDVVSLDVLDCNLPLAQIYRGITFEESAAS